jgi:DMSO/TMAO reductase YedYZ molybdopterin-dependent catalytic subunit
MGRTQDIFTQYPAKPTTHDGVYTEDERRLANRNSGILLETLRHDITPIGTHYLLIHFDVPHLEADTHRLTFGAGFENPYSLSMDEILAQPRVSMPVTLECAGNGRSRVSPRSHSMPWGVEAVGTSEWTGTPLAPLIDRAKPRSDTQDFVFTGADRGFDKGLEHNYGRSLTPAQLADLDVLLVYEMNGIPLLPQHGAPLRIVVPGWYGMASVKWLETIEAIPERFQGFQQVQTYRFRQTADDPGQPVTTIRVKSLMVPPGLPDWGTRLRYLKPGKVTLHGKAWSGGGCPITRVEFGVDGVWSEARLHAPAGRYAWTGWTAEWDASPGEHVLSCRATDALGNVQPLKAPWDASGFGNNMVQEVGVYVAQS